MGLSSREVNSADNTLNWSQGGVLDNISKQKPQPALKCPRCDSTNTKFCYYNNYSRMQPRHLCKACKRHWTAGGTLRNVPVGGGRKNKRAKTDSTAKTANGDDKLQLPFNVEYESNIFPDVLSQILSLPQPLPPTPLNSENYPAYPNKSIQDSTELSLSYWNCWDGLTEFGIQDLGLPEGLH